MDRHAGDADAVADPDRKRDIRLATTVDDRDRLAVEVVAEGVEDERKRELLGAPLDQHRLRWRRRAPPRSASSSLIARNAASASRPRGCVTVVPSEAGLDGATPRGDQRSEKRVVRRNRSPGYRRARACAAAGRDSAASVASGRARAPRSAARALDTRATESLPDQLRVPQRLLQRSPAPHVGRLACGARAASLTTGLANSGRARSAAGRKSTGTCAPLARSGSDAPASSASSSPLDSRARSSIPSASGELRSVSAGVG